MEQIKDTLNNNITGHTDAQATTDANDYKF